MTESQQPTSRSCFYCKEEIPENTTPCRYCGRGVAGSTFTDLSIFALEVEVKAEIPINGKALEIEGARWTVEVIRAWKLAEDTCRRFRLRLVGPTDDYLLTLIVSGEIWSVEQGRGTTWVLGKIRNHLRRARVPEDGTLAV